MDHKKRENLRKKGYEVLNLGEIFNFSETEEDYVNFKIFLSKSLKESREYEGLTQEAFAELIKSSQSRVAKMEACDTSVSIDLLFKAHIKLNNSVSDLFKEYESEKIDEGFAKLGSETAADTTIKTEYGSVDSAHGIYSV